MKVRGVSMGMGFEILSNSLTEFI
jgi:hypothetical protein